MRTQRHFLTACILSLLIFSCSKDANEQNDILEISPEKLASYAGKDWASISSEFSNKKDYRYTELNNGNVLAAVSLPARDFGAPYHNFKLLLNISQQHRVSSIGLNSADTMDVATGNKLFLYYYEKAFTPMDNVFYTFAIDDYDHQVGMEVEQLLSELRTFKCAQASLTYRNYTMNMLAGLYKGYFSFNISAP